MEARLVTKTIAIVRHREMLTIYIAVAVGFVLLVALALMVVTRPKSGGRHRENP